MDRDEAIAWLRARGVNASKRDWSYGKTIVIAASPPREYQGITGYDRIFHLYPFDDGSWIFMRLGPSQLEWRYPDLESAAQAALDALNDSSHHES